MGSFPIGRIEAYEELANLVGVRTGLAWSQRELAPFVGQWIPDLTDAVEYVRVRSSDFAFLVFEVLSACGDWATQLGVFPRIHVGEQLGPDRYKFAFNTIHDEVHLQEVGNPEMAHPMSEQCHAFDSDQDMSVIAATGDMWIQEARLRDLDVQLFLGRIFVEHGREARDDCALMLDAVLCEQRVDPYSRVTHGDSKDHVALESLYKRAATVPPHEGFFDQRLIDYLYANLDKVQTIHWRQFERLVAEYLKRQGYFVEIGPGGNDDGVDLRIWPVEPTPGTPPLVIVQCKRQASTSRIEKVVVKALWSDIVAYGATRGLVATTAQLSPGATQTIVGRGYGIDVADASAVGRWLEVMRTPGTGISLTGC